MKKDTNKVLNIVDFQFLYYKYKNLLSIGRVKPLSYNGKDTTLLYYPIKEIEGFSQNGKIRTCICFDSKAEKRESSDTYKSNRKSTLNESDFNTIANIRDILSEVGYEVYKEDGYEADDLIGALVEKNKCKYDEINIYTVDKDILQCVSDNVNVYLFRARKGYVKISKENFVSMSVTLFKTAVPYNLVKVYKCLCGDASDNIKGVSKFGPVAFEKWIKKNDIMYELCVNNEYIKQLFEKTLNETQYKQAEDALELVEFRDVKIKEPYVNENKVVSREIYRDYGMVSFLK